MGWATGGPGAKNKSSVKKKCSTMADAKKLLKILIKSRWQFFLTSVGVIIKRFREGNKVWSWQKSLEFLSGREVSLDDNFPQKTLSTLLSQDKKTFTNRVFNEKESIFAGAFVG